MANPYEQLGRILFWADPQFALTSQYTLEQRMRLVYEAALEALPTVPGDAA